MPSNASTALLPVILGGDFGVYGIGRSFNEAFACRSLCVSNSPAVAITRSNFFDVHHITAGISDADLLATLLAIAQANEGRELVLMANHDLHSSFIARNFDALASVYALPFPSQEIIDQLGSDCQIYWVTVYAPGVAWAAQSNATIKALADANSNVHLIDWANYAKGHRSWFFSDGIHLKPDGQKAYAELIRTSCGL